MTAEEYKIAYKALEKERGLPPADFWLTPDHHHNMQQPFLVKIFKKREVEYNRELQFQQELSKINKRRLKDAKNITSPGFITIQNGYKSNKGAIVKYFKNEAADAIIKGITTHGPNVSSDGEIYFQVELGRDKSKSTLFTTINQDEIKTYTSR